MIFGMVAVLLVLLGAVVILIRHSEHHEAPPATGEEPTTVDICEADWYLETMVEAGLPRRVRIDVLPFRVGRRLCTELFLPSDTVEKEHAELFLKDGELHVRDLGSKNGTFVNCERVTESPLREGDILHVAQVEFHARRSRRPLTVRGPWGVPRSPSTSSTGPGSCRSCCAIAR